MAVDQSKFSNKEIAQILRNIAATYVLTGVNRFRIIAYEKAADAVEHLTRELKDIWQDGKLYEIPGIGGSIGSHLEEYFKTGRSKHFNSILKQLPTSVFVLMNVSGIGPKKAFKLVKDLHLTSPSSAVADLKKAAQEGKIEELETFGDKSQKEILDSISMFKEKSQRVERMPLPYAFEQAEEIKKYLLQLPAVKRVDALGSLRRMVATIGDIDIAIQVKSYELGVKREKEIVDYFVKYPKAIKVDNAGDRKASIIISPNIRVDLRVQDAKSYGSMLQYFTGSKAHNINLREFALHKDLSLNEYGIKNLKSQNSNLHTFNTEEKFYHFLGLQYIPPEIREGTNEIELAKIQKIPKLIETKEIKGDLHIHSSYDLKPSHDFGKNSYREVLDYAEKLKYEYVGFADHNPKTSGMSEKKIIEIMKRRQQEIKKLENKETKFFIGLETDILPDGRLALPERAITYVDYLIVSVHSVFHLDTKTMTKRVLRALQYPKVKILGHPTGRLLGKREGYELDWNLLFEICTKKNIAVEINSWPERLDLSDTLVRDGLKNGVKFVINSDAHANDQMGNMFYGVSVARRGWCQKSDIINTLPYQKFKEWIIDKS